MKQSSKTVDFFLGSNSETGFVSHFAQLQNPYNGKKVYILKGGPGTGKSSLMKKLADEMKPMESLVERIHCSSDPDSLDGVILEQGKASVIDGTRPHSMEPSHAGAVETVVNLLSCVDDGALEKERDGIVEVSAVISGYHKKFCELLKCANVLMDSNRKMILPFVDLQKMAKTADRIAKKELKSGSQGFSDEKARMLSAFTPKGLVTYEETVKTLCKNRYFINDEYRVCAPVLLEMLRRKLKEKNISYYLCYSPFKAKDEIDHILIPELSLAFLTVNKYEPMESIEPTKVINALRFMNPEVFKAKKQRLSFYKKTSAEVLAEGISMLEKAKETHDELERFYLPHVNFQGIDEMYVKLKEQISGRY